MRSEGRSGESAITFIVRDGTWTISCDLPTVWLDLIILILQIRDLGISGENNLTRFAVPVGYGGMIK